MCSIKFAAISVAPALKSALPALCRVVSVCRFAHPHSLIAWCTRFLAGKKKAHVIGFLVPSVSNTKGFVSALRDESK